MRAQRRDALAREAVAVPCPHAVAIEHARDHVVTRDQRQRAHGLNHVGGRAGALAAPAAWQAVLGVGAAHPVQRQHDLGPRLVEVSNGLVEDSAHDPLLEPGIRCRCRPDTAQVRGQRLERRRSEGGPRSGRFVLGDARLASAHSGQSPVPTRLEFAGHQAVLGISGIVLPEGAVGREACRLQVAHHGRAGLVAPRVRLCLGRSRRLNRGRLHDRQER
ncbi:hypothetical protein Mnod_4798 [Methylobacterium nodulans ORS 2060]|uniref:Uncharacterized protein n=1 Tax=Methylobacterium nodulans (strain LMG 21967 / CNCM I-2342 / ORS 2060) TaxID=460265 RepID=B8IFV1_METNO|nr:hypothetical protein Mnod_4798 [Methylobacterium nodulans ORS 2060]